MGWDITLGLGYQCKCVIAAEYLPAYGRIYVVWDDSRWIFGGNVINWRDKAACLTVNPELFFPVGNTGAALEQIQRAKAVCARCTVANSCLQFALETNQDSGIWGGLSEEERRALKRRGNRARRANFKAH